MTRGGGALTLASQWKSQFDDSEETTDNEWKQEPQVIRLSSACKPSKSLTFSHFDCEQPTCSCSISLVQPDCSKSQFYIDVLCIFRVRIIRIVVI